jgi:type III secretory pathway component EscT
MIAIVTGKRRQSRKTMQSDWLALLRQALGDEPLAWGLAWARALPILVLVPAFGLGGVALPIRAALALGMAGCVAPALRALPVPGMPWWLALLRESAQTLPLGIGTAAILWAAVMAGGLADNLRGARDGTELAVLDEPTSPLGALFGLLVALGFLESGGAARIASALAEPRLHTSLAAAVERLAASVGIAASVAAPLVAGSLFIELGGAFIARAAAPAYIAPLVAPLRSLALLFVAWLALDRVVELLVVLASHA